MDLVPVVGHVVDDECLGTVQLVRKSIDQPIAVRRVVSNCRLRPLDAEAVDQACHPPIMPRTWVGPDPMTAMF